MALLADLHPRVPGLPPERLAHLDRHGVLCKSTLSHHNNGNLISPQGGRYGPAFAAYFEEQNQRIENGSFVDDDGENEEDLQEIIRESIAKRNTKDGTELLKKTKGKTKIAKGEVGGGSFQSMGALRCH